MGVVVVAAGSGTRLGADRPKAFVEVVGVSAELEAYRLANRDLWAQTIRSADPSLSVTVTSAAP